MPDSLESEYRPLLEAVAVAARAHRHQLRKDKETPYVSHVFRVCLVTREVFGVNDRGVLMAAVLHDSIEDTTTDFDDLEEKFGADIAGWVATLSKDKRRPEAEREQAYVEQLTRAPWQVKVAKLADIFDNLMDSIHTEPRQQAKTFKNSHRYLEALKPGLPEQAQRPWEIVSQLLSSMEKRAQGHPRGT